MNDRLALQPRDRGSPAASGLFCFFGGGILFRALAGAPDLLGRGQGAGSSGILPGERGPAPSQTKGVKLYEIKNQP